MNEEKPSQSILGTSGGRLGGPAGYGSEGQQTSGVMPDKQSRKVELSIQPILDALARSGLKNIKLREARADARQMKIILHIETDAEPGAPLVVQVDWNKVFGDYTSSNT
jgi:hypothetical protein